ncbi:MAG: polysaccharide biosynthesis/export family protein [Gemmatimonadota bacterium]|jgi:polysaccharide export outer membrane protein|nr:polysaccharide biosynthesis/export family protein [Gemmatimonadota bacterium]MDQ3606641.1 polysaccharide biosynthesis/export family protein [Gemmatimonadota bacterium]
MHRHFFSLILGLLLIPAAAAAQNSAGKAPDAVTLQPGDVVRVAIWREEDLSGDFSVDETGVVTFPLLGDKQVTGIPMRQLREVLIEEYRIHLRNPSISITPLRRVNVLGEVNKPGLYEVDPTISLAGAVALAGGATASGDLNRIRVIRSGTMIRERVAAQAVLNDADIRSGDQIFIERRNWFERNSTFVVSVLLSVTSIAITLVR